MPNFSEGLPGPNQLRGASWTPGPNGQFTPINPGDLENLAVQADLGAETSARAAFAKRYPLLQAADEFDMNSDFTNLAGQEDPQIHEALATAGLGNVDFGANNPYLYARNMGQPILSKQMRDRNYNQRLFSEHPVHQLGLGPSDIANIAAWNTGGANAFNQGVAGINLQNYDQQQLANSQLEASIIGGIGQVGAAGIKTGFSNPQTSPSYYAFNAPPVYGGDWSNSGFDFSSLDFGGG